VFPGGIREIGNPSESEFTQSAWSLMNKSQKILGAVILLLLAVSIYGFWISRDPEARGEEPSTKKSKDSNATVVDLSPLKAAQQVAKLATLPTSVRSPRKRCTRRITKWI